jgi:hypothetical protein
MATNILAGDLVALRVFCTSQEQASVNTFHYGVTEVGSGSGTDLDMAEAFDTLIAGAYQDILCTTASYNGVQAQIILRDPTTIFMPASVSSTVGAGPGLVSGNELPRQVCGLISWKTALAGRKNRGRTYFPFPPVSFDTGLGVPSSTAQGLYGAISTLAFDFVSLPASGLHFQLSLFHRNFPAGTPPIPSTYDPIVAATQVDKWATQRRRGSYGRANVSPI